jgi:hypothetical protein
MKALREFVGLEYKALKCACEQVIEYVLQKTDE